MKKNLCCTDDNMKYEWVTQKNGSRHVTAKCTKCGTNHQYVNQATIDTDRVVEKLKSNELF